MRQIIQKFLDELRGGSQGASPFMANSPTWKPGDYIYYSGPYWDDSEVIEIFQSILTSKWLSSGDRVRTFEQQFSKKYHFAHSVMVNSGSSANLVMLAALKEVFQWPEKAEIIVSASGFPTTVSTIIQNGLKPVFVDIDLANLNWNLDEVARRITKNTVAVMSSPALGNPYDIDQLVSLCKVNNLKIIADNCDSLGSKWRDAFLTDHAVAASCSFYAAHHLCTIEGGMVSSNNEDIIETARSFAWWGRGCHCVGSQNLLPNGVCQKRFSHWLDGYDGVIDHKYVFSQMGYNLKPLDLCGAIGSIQLRKANEMHTKRRANKIEIQRHLETIKGVRVIKEKPKAETSWFGVPIVCESKELKQKLVMHLESNMTQTRNYFGGNLLLQPAFKGLDEPSHYPNSSRAMDTVFFLGCSPTISEEMIQYIGKAIERWNGVNRT